MGISPTITKYIATSKKPGAPKALQVNVPSKKAAAIPEIESPETRIGEPTKKMRRLLRIEDVHVGGDAWMILRAPEKDAWKADAEPGRAIEGSILEGLDLGRRGFTTDGALMKPAGDLMGRGDC